MIQKIKVGYMPLSKASWQTPRIVQLADMTLGSLKKLPAEIIHGSGLVTTEAEAEALAAEFNRQAVDAVILHLATFPVGAMIPLVAQRLNVPIILLANPETPLAGGILEQNSFCGANLAAHILHQLRRKYAFAWGTAETAAQAVAKPLQSLTARAALGRLRLGLAGGRVPGFYTSNFSELKLRARLGVTVEVLELLEIVKTAEQLAPAEVVAGREAVARAAANSAVAPADLELAGRLLTAFKRMAEKYRLDGYAVRCWPEFSDHFGIAPCAVLGLLTDLGLAASCESDIHGAVTMQLLKLLAGGGTPFFVDLIQFDYKENTGVVWHCGAAPASLCRNFAQTTLRRHLRVDGGDKKGLTNDFPLKPGPVTLAKLDEAPDGHYRLLIAPGAALETEPFLRGNPLRIRFAGNMEKLIQTILQQGFEHHYAVIHADLQAELLDFCNWLDLEPVVVV